MHQPCSQDSNGEKLAQENLLKAQKISRPNWKSVIDFMYRKLFHMKKGISNSLFLEKKEKLENLMKKPLRSKSYSEDGIKFGVLYVVSIP